MKLVKRLISFEDNTVESIVCFIDSPLSVRYFGYYIIWGFYLIKKKFFYYILFHGFEHPSKKRWREMFINS